MEQKPKSEQRRKGDEDDSLTTNTASHLARLHSEIDSYVNDAPKMTL